MLHMFPAPGGAALPIVRAHALVTPCPRRSCLNLPHRNPSRLNPARLNPARLNPARLNLSCLNRFHLTWSA